MWLPQVVQVLPRLQRTSALRSVHLAVPGVSCPLRRPQCAQGAHPIEASAPRRGRGKLPVPGRHHFFALAARVMRQIVVDYARRKSAVKRGGDQIKTALDENLAPVKASVNDSVAVDQALQKLEALDPRIGKLVELRFFGGLRMRSAKSGGHRNWIRFRRLRRPMWE